MKYLPKTAQLQAFRAVARRGSVRSAARELGVTQPGLSRTLRELEQTLGTQLFLRSSEGVTLTEAGLAFSRRTEWIMEELRRAAEEVEQINYFTHGRLTVGLSSLISLTVFPQIAQTYKSALPQVTLTVREGQLNSLLPGIRSGVSLSGICRQRRAAQGGQRSREEKRREWIHFHHHTPVGYGVVITASNSVHRWLDDRMQMTISKNIFSMDCNIAYAIKSSALI